MLEVLLIAASIASLGMCVGMLTGLFMLRHWMGFMQNAVFAHEDMIADLLLKTSKNKDVPTTL